jgi:hypothetical protein
MKKISCLILGMSFSVFAQTNLTDKNMATNPSAPAAISEAVKAGTSCAATGRINCPNSVIIEISTAEAKSQGALNQEKAYVLKNGSYAPDLTAAQQTITNENSTKESAKSSLRNATTSGSPLPTKPLTNPTEAYTLTPTTPPPTN